MTGNVKTFRSGATAFRNARYSATRHRVRFVPLANAAAQLTAGNQEGKSRAESNRGIESHYGRKAIDWPSFSKASYDDDLSTIRHEMQAEIDSQNPSQA